MYQRKFLVLQWVAAVGADVAQMGAQAGCCRANDMPQISSQMKRQEEEDGDGQITQDTDAPEENDSQESMSSTAVTSPLTDFGNQACLVPPAKDDDLFTLPPNLVFSLLSEAHGDVKESSSEELLDAKEMMEQSTRKRQLTRRNLDLIGQQAPPWKEETMHRLLQIDINDIRRSTSAAIARVPAVESPSLDSSLRGKESPEETVQAQGSPRSPSEDSACSSSSRRKEKWRKRQPVSMLSTMDLVPSGALHVIIDRQGDIGTFYNLEAKKLGEGSFGLVKRGYVKATGAARAVKAISKELMKEKQGILRKEIEITKMVDHPNLVKLYELWEDDEHINLVLELCNGGSVLDRLRKHVKGRFSEVQTACVMFQVFRGIYYMHNNTICHRDMKLENCLLLTKDPVEKAGLANLKITDFGLSCNFKPRVPMTTRAGTLPYMAPEVFQKKYTQAVDMWSCGVMTYELLCGYLPFAGKSEQEITDKIVKGSYSFGTSEWVDISQECLLFVGSLLKKNPTARHTPQQAMHHDYMDSRLPKVKDAPLKPKLLQALRSFRSMNKLKRAALSVVASMLPQEEVQMSQDIFCSLDKDGDGHLSVAELREHLEKRGVKIEPPAKMDEPQKWTSDPDKVEDAARLLLKSADQPAPKKKKKAPKKKAKTLQPVVSRTQSDNDAVVDVESIFKTPNHELPVADDPDRHLKDFCYTEFLAATFDRSQLLKPDVCFAAFRSFDKNGDGSISMSELACGRLLGHLSLEELSQILETLDANGDCEIDFEEFTQLMAG